VSLPAEFRVVMSALKRCSVRLYLQLFVVGLMSYLRYLYLFAYSGVQHILCCVFVLFVFVWCTLYCQFLWIVHFWLPLSVFFNVYLFYYINIVFVCEREEEHELLQKVRVCCIIYCLLQVGNYSKLQCFSKQTWQRLNRNAILQDFSKQTWLRWNWNDILQDKITTVIKVSNTLLY